MKRIKPDRVSLSRVDNPFGGPLVARSRIGVEGLIELLPARCIELVNQRLPRVCRFADERDSLSRLLNQVDLQLRGPGDLAGTQQSGALDLKIADLSKDQLMLSAARELALEIMDEDPLLKNEKNYRIAEQLQNIKKKKTDWSKIS